MNIEQTLVTGAAGFIGSHVAMRLLDRGERVVGLDNLNDYYDPSLKRARLDRLTKRDGFEFVQLDVAERSGMEALFKRVQPRRVVHLAAQAGVRYSLTNPYAYIDSNLQGFITVLEGCRHHGVEHLVYASSSSVYGSNERQPFSEHDNIDHPVSLYAASKKANELMAHTYSHLYKLPTTGLRFFTVYGPWGRPDMALFIFTKALLAGEPIRLFNEGKMIRDFTYIDDIVEGVIQVLDRPPAPDQSFDPKRPDPATSNAPYRVLNIGNNCPVQLLDFVRTLERCLGRETKFELLPMQPGDVVSTMADVTELERATGYRPHISIDVGIARFVEWYKEYYGVGS